MLTIRKDPMAPSPKNFLFLTLENETDVNENWPLAKLRPRLTAGDDVEGTGQQT
jgi:hypothetical protein